MKLFNHLWKRWPWCKFSLLSRDYGHCSLKYYYKYIHFKFLSFTYLYIFFFFFIIFFSPDLLLCNVKYRYTIFHIIVCKIVAKALVLAVDCALLWPMTPLFFFFMYLDKGSSPQDMKKNLWVLRSLFGV